MSITKLLILATLPLLVCCCENDEPSQTTLTESQYEYYSFLRICSFENENSILDFKANSTVRYSVALNPEKGGTNRSSRCGKVVSGGAAQEKIYISGLSRKLDFTANPAVFMVDVLSPKTNGKVAFRLQSNSAKEMLEVVRHTTVAAGQWETMIFDFSDKTPESNVFYKFSILFDAYETGSGEEWYFDNIKIPNYDLVDICLFKRYEANPVFNPTGQPAWCRDHMANAGIISPANSPDGNWWMYLRGSGTSSIDGQYHDQIGLFRQNAADFKPFGPWIAYEGNPVINHGTSGAYDDRNILDTAPVVGKDGVVYVYYNGNNFNGTHGLCGAYSTDGGYTFTKFDAPLIEGFGCSDVVYYNEKYYIFYAGGTVCKPYVTITDNPSKSGTTYPTIELGGGPSNFDSVAINGAWVFRLDGVDKWFAAYQGSSMYYDFPDRFHIIYSDDLIHWTKVQNDKPLFTRGKIGQWDQGAIWFPEIIEHDGMLYLYYEGWGKVGYVADRNIPYFGGRSCIGAASASKADFLKWCGM